MKTAEVPLKNGMICLVDEEDLPKIQGRSWFNCKKGNVLYAVTQLWNNGNPTTVRMHRLILGAEVGQVVDHINHNGLDNRKSNLRICTNAQNKQNSRKLAPSSSIYKGVWKMRRKWAAQVQFNGEKHYLGVFESEKEAAEAYNRKLDEINPQFGYGNHLFTKEDLCDCFMAGSLNKESFDAYYDRNYKYLNPLSLFRQQKQQIK